jgi:hypothetical protein
MEILLIDVACRRVRFEARGTLWEIYPKGEGIIRLKILDFRLGKK